MLVDFTKFAGQTLVMKNHKPPKPVSTPAPVARVGHADPRRHDGHPPRSRPRSRRACPAARPTCIKPVTTRYITLNEIDPEEVDLVPEPERRPLRRRTDDGDPEGRHGGGLGLRQPDRGHPPDAHAPGDVPGDRPHPVRRRGLRGGLRRARTASPAESTRPRSPPVRWSRRRPRSAASRTRSRRTPATSPPSGPSSTCRQV